MAIDIPRIRHDEPWESANVDTWREKLRASVIENDRRIAAMLQIASFAAYGGMNLSVPTGFPDIDSSYQSIDVFDVLSPAVPRGVVVNLAPNHSFSMDVQGVYLIAVTGGFDHNEMNQGRTTNIRFFNQNTLQPIGPPILVGTGRNASVTSIAIAAFLEIGESEKNQSIQLQIGGGDDYSLVEFNYIELAIFNVGEWREPLLPDVVA